MRVPTPFVLFGESCLLPLAPLTHTKKKKKKKLKCVFVLSMHQRRGQGDYSFCLLYLELRTLLSVLLLTTSIEQNRDIDSLEEELSL